MGDKIILEEYPATPDLGSCDASCFGALPQLLCVHVQEDGRFGKVEGSQRESRASPGLTRLFVPPRRSSRKILCVLEQESSEFDRVCRYGGQ
jgi:hypothetical protein